MNRSFVIVSLITVLVSCKAQETTSSTASTSTTATQVIATTAAPVTTTTVATTQTTATIVAAPAGSSLASQETNWQGVTAEVSEFRRKGNTLTAKVRLVNKRAERKDPEIHWKDVALIDTAGGKKYEVLKEEKGTFLASTQQGWNDRWHEWIDGNSAQTVWMKFPAPPPEVKSITLQLPNTPPFDDLTIQD